MTTIACDGNSMAGDGMVCCGGTVHGRNFVKVRQIGDGRIVGFTGSAYDIEPFCAWLSDGGDRPTLSEEFEALVLDPKGECRAYSDKCESIIEELPTACGSGKEFALAAMDAGAEPSEAVEIAAQRSLGTGGTITVIHRPRKLRRVA
jgi:ATP-dependent protease HslVU (ClpYQ) peptidase subunit